MNNKLWMVHLIDSQGNGSYLSVKGQTVWKTKRVAKRHVADIQTCINAGKNLWDCVVVELEEV